MTANAEKIKAIGLLSGGLDSILAIRTVQEQGVDVLGLHFISSFYSAGMRGREAEVEKRFKDVYSINARVIDISDEFMNVVAAPRYGYGKNFNPCIDCKIFLFTKALAIMKEEGARFLITGEVLGQRPMSQRRDAMSLIAKQLGAADILLRPLCAKKLAPTLPEREGWVDRERLHAFSGRSRKPQMALAEAMGITQYPTPAGGCRLTDPILAARVERYFKDNEEDGPSSEDVRLLMAGRPFVLGGNSIFTMGRSQGENKAVGELARPGDEFAKVLDAPGPLGLLRYRREGVEEADRQAAASVLMRYTPKAGGSGRVGFFKVESAGMELTEEATPDTVVEAVNADEALLEEWKR